MRYGEIAATLAIPLIAVVLAAAYMPTYLQPAGRLAIPLAVLAFAWLALVIVISQRVQAVQLRRGTLLGMALLLTAALINAPLLATINTNY